MSFISNIKRLFKRSPSPEEVQRAQQEALERKERIRQDIGDFVDSFQPLGFFDQYSNSREEIVNKLIEELGKDSHWGVDWNSEASIMAMPELKRIYWPDLEADVSDGNSVYQNDVLPELASISCGTFLPEQIKESWDSPKGPIHISFLLDGKQRRIQVDEDDDWINLEVLHPINSFMATKGRQFHVLEFEDQTARIICLTEEEHSKLQNERGWRFLPADHVVRVSRLESTGNSIL